MCRGVSLAMRCDGPEEALMIDIKHTTLVPSYRALAAFKGSGTLDALVAEAELERAVVSEHVDRRLDEVTVDLSLSALAVRPGDLERAAADPGLRRRLIGLHVIHPDPQPVAKWRELGVDEIGVGRHHDETWLWFASPSMKRWLEARMERLGVRWVTPIVEAWPVAEALVLPVGFDMKSFDVALSNAAIGRADVDPNGRPFPQAAVLGQMPEDNAEGKPVAVEGR